MNVKILYRNFYLKLNVPIDIIHDITAMNQMESLQKVFDKLAYHIKGFKNKLKNK